MIENEKEIQHKKSFREKIKNKTLKVYYKCLEHINIPDLLYLTFIVFSFLNIITYFLFDEFNKLYNYNKENTNSFSYANYIKIIPRIINISFYFKYKNERKIFMLISFFYSVINLFLFIFLNILKSFHIKQKIISRIFYILSLLLFWIFLMPFLDISINYFLNINKENSILLYQILSVFTILFILLISILFCFYGFNSKERVDCNNELFYLILRILIILIYNIVNKYNRLSKYIIIVVNLFSSIILGFYNYNKYLYYKKKFTITYLFCIFFYFYCCLLSLLLNVLKKYKEPFWLFILGFGFIYKISFNIIQKKEYYFLYYYNENDFNNKIIKKKYLLDKYLRLLENQNNIENMIKIYKNYLQFLINTNNQNFYITILISYLHYQFEYNQNYIDILININNINNNPEIYKKLIYQQKFSFFILKFKTLKKLKNSYYTKNSVPIESIIEYYTLLTNIKKNFIESANIHYNFWNNLYNDIINNQKSENASHKMIINNYYDNYNKILKKVIEMFDLNYKIDNIYNKLHQIYPNDFFINLKYYDYINKIKGFDIGNNKYNLDYINNYEDYFNNNEINKIYGENNCIIICNLKNNNQLIITKVTDNIHTIFGYNSNQLLGKYIEFIQPPFFQNLHKTFVDNYVQTGYNVIFKEDKNSNFYGYDNMHYLILLNLKIKILLNEHVYNKISFISLIHYIDVDYGIILCKPNGKIDSINSNIYNLLSMNIDDFYDNDIYIYHLFMSMLINNYKLSKFNLNKFYSDNFSNDINVMKIKMCDDKNIIINFRNDLKNNKNKIKEQVNKYINAYWPEVDIIIEKHSYELNEKNSKDYTYFIIKIFYDENISSSNEESEIHDIGNNNKIGLSNKMENYKIFEHASEEESSLLSKENITEKTSDLEKKIIIKNLHTYDGIENSINVKKYLLMGDKNNDNQKKIRLEQNNLEFAIKLSKLKELLNSSSKVNIYITLISIITFIMLFIITIYIFIHKYKRIGLLRETYNIISNNYLLYNEMNCVKKFYIQKKYENLYNNHFEFCNKKLLNKINNIYKITENSYLNSIKNIYLLKTFNNSDITSLQTLLIFIENMNRNYDINNDNFFELIYSIFYFQNETNSEIFLNKVNYNKNYNRFEFIINFIIIIVLVVTIVPLIFTKHKNQINLLERFYKNIFGNKNNIYFNEIKQMKDLIKEFIRENINFNLESEENQNEQNNIINNEKSKLEKNLNIAFNNKSKNQTLSLKKKTNNDNDKKNKKIQSNNKIEKIKISIVPIILKIILKIILMIIFLIIIPVISYFTYINYLNNSNKYIQFKNSIDSYSFFLERYLVYTLNLILIDKYFNQPLNLTLISKNLNELSTNLSNYEKFFSSETANKNDFMSEYQNLYDFLQRDMCSFFKNYKYNIENCETIQENNSQKGIKPIYSRLTTILIDLSQIIINGINPKNLYNETYYIYLNSIYYNFIYNSFELILEMGYKSYKNECINNEIICIVLFVINLIVMIINSVLILNRYISRELYRTEVNTYKVENIFFKFV